MTTTALARARALYVKTVTRPEREALEAAERYALNAPSSMAARAKRRLREARDQLAEAEIAAGRVFEAVISGRLAP